MEITVAMMYDFANLIRADLEIDGLGEGCTTRIVPKRPIYRSDLEKIFERWCPNAEEVQNLRDELKAANDRIEELENRCDDYTDANNDLGERLTKLNKEYERLGKQNKTLCASNDMLKSSNMVLKLETESIAKLKKENQEYVKANEELGKQISELNSKVYILECEKAMSNFSKIFAGGEADCSKCIWRENSEKKDERITELMNENDLLSKSVIKKDSKLNSEIIVHKLIQDANTVLMEQNRKYGDTICEQNATINSLKSELEGAIKDRDRVYADLHDIKTTNNEMVIRKLRKQRDKAVNGFKSLKSSHESMVLQRNHYKGLTEKLECCNNSLRDDLNNLKENFVQFDVNDIVVRAMDNIYIVLGDGNHVKGFIIVNRKYNAEMTGYMITYSEFRDKFKGISWCTGEEKYFTEFCLPKAHYDLAVYSE